MNVGSVTGGNQTPKLDVAVKALEDKLSIAMIALQKITGDIYDEEEASEETIAYRALAQIKGGA